MMRRYNRLLVLFYVVSDAVLAMTAFLLAYIIRFELLSGVIPVTKGYPPLEQYLRMLPFIQAIVPIAFYAQGLYHLRRERTRVDDFFAVFVGTIMAVVIGVGGTLYFQAYYVSDELKDAGVYEISQLVWAIFLVVKGINQMRRKEEEAPSAEPPPPTREEGLLIEIRDLLKK